MGLIQIERGTSSFLNRQITLVLYADSSPTDILGSQFPRFSLLYWTSWGEVILYLSLPRTKEQTRLPWTPPQLD